MGFWLGALGRLSVLLIAALLLGVFVDVRWGIALAAVGFALSHGYHLWQLDRLRRWVAKSAPEAGKGETPPVPDAFGAWGLIFAALFRQRRAERAGRDLLAASLERLSLAAEALPDGIVLLDEQLRIEWCNPAAARHLGIDAGRDRGIPIVHLVREPEFAAYLAQGGAPITLRPAGGPVKTMSLALIPFADSGRLMISRDVTAIERAETIRRDFVANVSHELRTPLTVIVGFLEAMLDSEPQHRQLAMMHEQAQRMQRLVDDLLTLSRLDAGQTPAREEVIDVPALLDGLLEEGRALSAGRHTLSLELATRQGLRGSREEIRSAFANLVSNAVRYTPEGGAIRLRWALRDGQPAFAVEDTGIGIAAEHIPRLTERFYRVDRGRSSATGGTGLGLAIVKHVLLRHGGRLEILSTPGRGSTISALLPAERLLPEPILQRVA